MAGENQGRNNSLSRRKFLKMTGAGVAALGMGAYSGDKVAQAVKQNIGMKTTKTPAGAATGGQDYELIEVGSGDTFRKDISAGETWENKLIDITASGAGYFITNDGGPFTMRNIGIRGQWDHDPGSSRIVLDVENENESALVENVCMTDGAVNNHGQTDPGGFFVHGDHAGEITFRNINVQNFGDNGIYASGPGTSHSGHFGVVHFENVYAANNGTAGLRLGTEGSTAKNCVAWNNTRGLWCLFEHIEATNCDFGNNGHDIRVGSNSQEQGYKYGELTVDNCRYESTDVVRSQNAIHGSSTGTPQHRGPGDIGAPTTPVEAASGAAGGGGSGTGGTGGGSTEPPSVEPFSENFDNGLDGYSGDTDAFEIVEGGN